MLGKGVTLYSCVNIVRVSAPLIRREEKKKREEKRISGDCGKC